MEDHNVIACARNNIVALTSIEEQIRELYEIDLDSDKEIHADLLDRINSLRKRTLKLKLEAEMRQLQKRIEEL